MACKGGRSNFDLAAHAVYVVQFSLRLSRWRNESRVQLRDGYGDNASSNFDFGASLPTSQDQAFGPGAVYDFFVTLRSVISSANNSLFLIDPYMDDQIFDTYLSSTPSSVLVRILCSRYSASVKAAAVKYTTQFSTPIDARSTSSVHDRLVFVDNAECWVMGASIKDAASKPTYLAPLSPDVSKAKLAYYETIWGASSAI